MSLPSRDQSKEQDGHQEGGNASRRGIPDQGLETTVDQARGQMPQQVNHVGTPGDTFHQLGVAGPNPR